MKKLISVLLSLLTLISVCSFTFVGASAAVSTDDPKLVLDESYDEESKTITVKVTVKNAVGITSGIVDLVFDDEMCSYKEDSFKTLADGLTAEGGKTVDNTYECACAFIAANSIEPADCDENGDLLLCEFQFNVKGDYKKDSFYLYTEGIEVNNSTKDDIEPVGNTDMAPVKNTTANKAAKTTKESSAKTDTKKSDNTVLFVIIAVAVIAAAAVITVAVSKKKKSAELNGENDKASSGEKNEDKNSTDGKEE